MDANSKPRVQVPTASGTALPFQARVTAYAADAPMAGQLTLTLDTALAVNPAANDPVYAGGPAVLPVAAAALGYVDSIGPSRSSGYAEAGVTWRDCVCRASSEPSVTGPRRRGWARCAASSRPG